MSVVRLCAGVEGTLASARATPISEQPPALAHSSESDGDAGAKTGEDAVDELGGENDDSAKAIPTKPTVPALTTPLAVATAPPSNVDEQTGTRAVMDHSGMSLMPSRGVGPLRLRCRGRDQRGAKAVRPLHARGMRGPCRRCSTVYREAGLYIALIKNESADLDIIGDMSYATYRTDVVRALRSCASKGGPCTEGRAKCVYQVNRMMHFKCWKAAQ